MVDDHRKDLTARLRDGSMYELCEMASREAQRELPREYVAERIMQRIAKRLSRHLQELPTTEKPKRNETGEQYVNRLYRVALTRELERA